MRTGWHYLAAAFRSTGQSVLTEPFFDRLERRPWAGRVRVKIPRPGKRRDTSPRAGTVNTNCNASTVTEQVPIYNIETGTVELRPRDASAPNVSEILDALRKDHASELSERGRE